MTDLSSGLGVFMRVLEFIGTFAGAISGVRLASVKRFDWFGASVIGFITACGGGTLRDMLLRIEPFWMSDPFYIGTCALAVVSVGLFGRKFVSGQITWFVFDTLGLALFTIAGIQKSLAFGQPYWVAIIMGCITGSAGGVIRDVLLNNEPVIFQREIYAMASVLGGLIYWLLDYLCVPIEVTVISSFFIICLMRFFAVRYHLALPKLKDD